jgi:hypothetical protein
MTTPTVTPDPAGKCQWCGMIHVARCPLVRALEYFDNGMLKRVEFHDPLPINWDALRPLTGASR